jgi:hypothetical protein
VGLERFLLTYSQTRPTPVRTIGVLKVCEYWTEQLSKDLCRAGARKGLEVGKHYYGDGGKA